MFTRLTACESETPLESTPWAEPASRRPSHLWLHVADVRARHLSPRRSTPSDVRRARASEGVLRGSDLNQKRVISVEPANSCRYKLPVGAGTEVYQCTLLVSVSSFSENPQVLDTQRRKRESGRRQLSRTPCPTHGGTSIKGRRKRRGHRHHRRACSTPRAAMLPAFLSFQGMRPQPSPTAHQGRAN